MNKAKIAAVGIVALALTGIGVGSAVAATPAPTPSGSSSVAPEAGGAAETPGTEVAETPGTEASTPSDGPGGWADPAGADVNSQGGAQQ